MSDVAFKAITLTPKLPNSVLRLTKISFCKINLTFVDWVGWTFAYSTTEQKVDALNVPDDGSSGTCLGSLPRLGPAFGVCTRFW